MKANFLIFILLIFSAPAIAQLNAAENYIVVVGAFASRDNAARFVRTARTYNLKPKSELNKMRGLYYVYVLESGDKTQAMIEAERLREATPMKDAWVYSGYLGDVVIPAPVEETPSPVVEEPLKEVVASEPPPPPVKTEEEKIKEAVESKKKTLKKGETETLNYIYFYRDAAVLRPESKYEVDRLVKLMKDHPEEKILIHGHTNGNDKGPIIRLKDGSKDFFSLENTVQDYGSAQKLSELRALLIRDYLVFNGINISRMSIKAWGGKKPLFQVDDERAEANVRVEIEVLNKD